MEPISFWHRLTDMVAPRSCEICGCRLSVSESLLCPVCDLQLPRTAFAASPYHNEMAKMLWGKMTVERVAALFYYAPRSEVAEAVYRLKYARNDRLPFLWGQRCAREMAATGFVSPADGKPATFFDGIDVLIPMPLTPRRERERGYNQSREMAKGIAEVTGIAIRDNVVERISFKESQTQKHLWTRQENVEGAFTLRQTEGMEGRHALVIDDILTTGATVCALAHELSAIPNLTVSVLTLGFSKH